ncbi:MAG: hypothetical protein M1818_008053 [Claussenomyces sp. TS43310]|nr:MAG: hypothetical protein M1818_008053 [Claussenomyces sp. TS43310]
MNGVQERKGLGLRDSQDSATSNSSTLAQKQNPNPSSVRGATGFAQRIPPQLQALEGRMVLDGYRKDIMTNFEGEKPRYNPMNSTRPHSSMLLNMNDSIQVHLLAETALGDSKEFEVLSQDEVDDLKKQCHTLQQRIEQVRQNLVVQSKYRDAASSMAKLYSPTTKSSIEPKKSRRSLIGRNSRSGSLSKADEERLSSERKCEELAQELWVLEKRLMEPQRRLLQHTAGILQMTHRGLAKGPSTGAIDQRGIPGSPESMYTYTNGRSSIEPIIEEDLFDDRSLYRTFDRLDGIGLDAHSTSYDTQSQISSGFSASTVQGSEQMKMIIQTEKSLEELNNRLREVIMKTKAPRHDSYGAPPHADATETSGTPGKLLSSHLEYLEQGIKVMDEEQARTIQEKQSIANQHRNSDIALEETLEDINREVRTLLLPFDSGLPLPPPMTGKSLQDQISYFQSLIDGVRHELERASSDETKGVAQLDQVETILRGLWDIIQSGEEDIRQRRQQHRQARAKMGVEAEDDSDLSSEEIAIESFSIQNFSAKVQYLFAQATSLKDQKKVLQRQIKQQRELKGQADKTRSNLTKDLEQTEMARQVAEKQANDLQTQLLTVMEQLDKSRRESTQRGLEKARKENEESVAIRTLQEKLQTRNDEIAGLEGAMQELKDDHGVAAAELQSRVQSLTDELAQASQDGAAQEEVLAEQVRNKDAEMESMNMEIARLQTEVTIARAELDGAYGSRAQRAAEVAANPAIQKEIDDLTSRNRTLQTEMASLQAASEAAGGTHHERVAQLQKELSETIEEYEVMTKGSIEWEKEREGLEREIDKLREERETLEMRLSDEQVRWLGVCASPRPGSPDAAGLVSPVPVAKGRDTSTTVLKNEFKKMMRDARMEGARALRAEQAERRRLEEELRVLKKQHGPGRSGLSHSVSGT